MQKYKIARIILLFAVSVQMLSCSKTAGDDPAGMDASLALSLLTRNGNGDLALTAKTNLPVWPCTYSTMTTAIWNFPSW